MAYQFTSNSQENTFQASYILGYLNDFSQEKHE